MRRTIAATFIGLALTAATVAAEPGGTVTGTIDGQAVELSIWPEQSDYDGSLDDRWIVISLIARDEALAQWGGSLMYIQIEAFDLPGDGASLLIIDSPIRDTTPSRTYVGKYDS